MSGTVLFVDDDRWLLDAIRALLKDADFRALTTTDPLKALPLVEWERVDVLVCDVDMPEISGVDLVVRARQLYPDVVRIILTAGTTLDAAVRAVNEGEIFRLLKKPISAEALAAVLAQALDRRDTLRRNAAVEGASRLRASAMHELEADHPGIGSVFLPDGIYVVSPDRLAQIEGLFSGSALGQLLAADALKELSDTLEMSPEDLETVEDDPFANLRREYGRALPERAKRIRAALEEAWRRDEASALEGVRREAHAVAGSAGTYGFDAVGAAFLRLEQILHDLTELRGTESEPQLWQQVIGALERAEASLPPEPA